MSSTIKEPPELNPDLPAPDPERVALLQGLEWPEQEKLVVARGSGDFDAYAAQFTINGRALNDQEKALLGRCTPNDLVASLHLTYEAVKISGERVELNNQLDALLDKYGFSESEDHTLGQMRAAMTPADGAEFDRLADALFPDGYLYLKGLED